MLGLQFTVARSQSFFTSLEFLDIPAMGSANAYCVASLLVSKATASAVGCFQSFFTSFEFLDIPAMGSANAHCVASLLVSKATASTCAVIGNMSTGCTSFSL